MFTTRGRFGLCLVLACALCSGGCAVEGTVPSVRLEVMGPTSLSFTLPANQPWVATACVYNGPTIWYPFDAAYPDPDQQGTTCYTVALPPCDAVNVQLLPIGTHQPFSLGAIE